MFKEVEVTISYTLRQIPLPKFNKTIYNGQC